MTEYNPDNVSVVINGEKVEGYATETTLTFKTPLDISIEIKDIGLCKGTIYLSVDQLNKFKEKYNVV